MTDRHSTPYTIDDLPWTPCVSDGPVTQGMPVTGLILVRHLNGGASVVEVARLAREGWGFVVTINGPVQDWMAVGGVYEASEVGLDASGQVWNEERRGTDLLTRVH